MTATDPAPRFTLQRLEWSDETLGTIELPARAMRLRTSFGSGLTVRPGDPPGIVWGVGDRGPNLKVEKMVERYGLEDLRPQLGRDGAKVMPRPDIGPRIGKLRVTADRVELLESFALHDPAGRPLSGLPIPGGDHARQEPVFDLEGRELPPDSAGADTEGIAPADDGGFWISDEFGPSLLRVDDRGRVLARYVPEGVELPDAPFPVTAVLPAIAAARQLNRGFEAIARSGDGRWLYLMFQSPLAHPDVAAHRKARHVRLWRLDASSLRVDGQFLYPLDPPEAFRRDQDEGRVKRSDLKVSELVWLGEDRLLVLERATLGTKLYRVELGHGCALPPHYLDPATRPTVEELSAAGALDLPVLGKRLVLDTDLVPMLPGDQEGLVVLSPTELLLVNDNDFGVEGAMTQFWKVIFDEPVLE